MRESVDVAIETFDASTAVLTDELRDLYGAVYAEAPYHDGPDDVAEFVAEWPGLLRRPGFDLAVARANDGLAGFALGHTVDPASDWWPANRPGGTHNGEGPGPSFGIAEFGVHPRWRRHGIARRVHDALLAGRPELRAVLWVRGDAAAATAAYRRWGYRLVGEVPDRPPYQVMSLDRTKMTPGAIALSWTLVSFGRYNIPKRPRSTTSTRITRG